MCTVGLILGLVGSIYGPLYSKDTPCSKWCSYAQMSFYLHVLYLNKNTVVFSDKFKMRNEGKRSFCHSYIVGSISLSSLAISVQYMLYHSMN